MTPPIARLLADPRLAVTENTIVCLICCGVFRQLTNTHLRAHGTGVIEYKAGYAVVASLSAETKLLMEGIAHSNYKGLEKMLKAKPEDTEAWTFARGQALLVAETGNLLLLRPPKNQGQDAWNKNAAEMREAATRLARSAAERDLNTSRARLIEVANACNRCHQSFRVSVRLTPFQEADK